MQKISNKIIAGDSSDIWEVGFQTSAAGAPVEMADLNGGFSCRLVVAGTAIDRVITDLTDDLKYFRAWLTPAETMALTGIITVGIQISNPSLTPPLVLEKQINIQMVPGIVPNS